MFIDPAAFGPNICALTTCPSINRHLLQPRQRILRDGTSTYFTVPFVLMTRVGAPLLDLNLHHHGSEHA
ncbi:hypothetical protein BC938DRAFT_474733 [Jimgerdemannia flammicorona]|uniref:Uncharacterized protein n=1 Tax=Jimgerdemannia flammicorona TaxID=994334 RepID=A0A433Q1V3_9FUNG|nr:hypothetical protein BC938DRAFT_474733 [Jimgerdemannia flammicorona]